MCQNERKQKAKLVSITFFNARWNTAFVIWNCRPMVCMMRGFWYCNDRADMKIIEQFCKMSFITMVLMGASNFVVSNWKNLGSFLVITSIK